MLLTLFPFLRWFPLTRETLRADLAAGVTVALVLVPQSMAYAQLAGLPVIYGLYASFVPVVMASLWGSSNQLHTGPTAMLSLMSAAALIPLASPGSPTFIELSILLALMVGVLRVALGLARLGVLVNLVSSPVLVGFTNAAALIIGLSQLNKLIGVPFPRSDSYLSDLWAVVMQLPQTHLPTLLFALGAFVLIRGLERLVPRLPAVLLAVVACTAVSAATDYEQRLEVPLEAVADPEAARRIKTYLETTAELESLAAAVARKGAELRALQAQQESAEREARIALLSGEIEALRAQAEYLKQRNNRHQVQLYAMVMNRSQDTGGAALFYREGHLPPGVVSDGRRWRFSGTKEGRIVFSAGGTVVGRVPSGLPAFQMPEIHWDALLTLVPAAFVMALIGFMEATSISKAIAARTGQRVDVNQELIGQGLANIVGSFFSAYTVSGSFSRSALAARAGARSGLFAIISALAVVAVLLWLTPFVYHLPEAVLAVIVMLAVFGLIRVKPLVHAWRVERGDAVIGLVTFAATLAMAPAIANGILVGIVLTVLAYLVKIMKPRAEILGRRPDGVLAGIEAHGLKPVSECVVPIRFDGSLVFASVAYFEDIVLEARARFPKAHTILIIGSGINRIDASGEEKIRELAQSLRQGGVSLAFSSLKKQVREVFEIGGLIALLGKENIFDTKEQAMQTLLARAGGG
ncbi:MAG: sodium-independent anion transporter [Azospira oryzae]|uniref:STAS domain-containing protein n=1 Tax=Pelomicrobium methylotrophicum TaxID=2602750 RepID=A0A5C7EFG2_9PROT|nr:MAG: sodium-independent anion transporter [Azospira oryzae]PZP82444.1 MAG: sodium-independent anion transporter [Azospira oryzae]TXF10953.1 STAS domain-containing protein [Pelomicrobium methylotrophicum]